MEVHPETLVNSSSRSSAIHRKQVPTEIADLELHAKKLQQENDYLSALKCRERALVLRQEHFGYRSVQVRDASMELGEYYNMLAMKCLHEANFDVCLRLLKKAQALAEGIPELQISTFNNFACFYRKQRKLRVALDFLQKAIKLESAMEEAPTAADTLLNACAVLSQLGRHEAALQQAQAALILLQESLVSVLVQRDKDQEEADAAEDTDSAQQTDAANPASSRVEKNSLTHDRIIVLAVAHHNIAVEHEYLGRRAQSLSAYRKAQTVASTHLGEDHPVTKSLATSLVAAEESLPARTASSPSKAPKQSSPKKPLGPKKKNPAAEKQAQAKAKERERAYKPDRLIVHDNPLEEQGSGQRSPSKRVELRFDNAMSAYGRIPGVTPVKCGKICTSEISRKLNAPPEKLNVSQFDAESLKGDFKLPEIAKKEKLEAMMTPRNQDKSAENGTTSEVKPTDQSLPSIDSKDALADSKASDTTEQVASKENKDAQLEEYEKVTVESKDDKVDRTESDGNEAAPKEVKETIAEKPVESKSPDCAEPLESSPKAEESRADEKE